MLWSDKTVHFMFLPSFIPCRLCCGFVGPIRFMTAQSCYENHVGDQYPVVSLCEEQLTRQSDDATRTLPTALPLPPVPAILPVTSTTTTTLLHRLVTCPAGHLTYCFLAEDEKASCWTLGHLKVRALNVQFKCGSSSRFLPYTLVCDHRQDCADNSDEDLCRFPPCTGHTPLQCATTKQCYTHSELCNGVDLCHDNSDEADCHGSRKSMSSFEPPAVIHFTPDGFDMTALPEEALLLEELGKTGREREGHRMLRLCPDTHFQCPDKGYCLPVFVRCNGVYDCPGKQDEQGCSNAECRGYFRCRGSAVCLHPDHVCDDFPQCPQRDDELLCDLVCPQHCVCLGLAVTCSTASDIRQLPESLRALDMSRVNVTVAQLVNLTMLVYLDLSRSQLHAVIGFFFPNVQTLILSGNSIRELSANDLRSLPNLRHLKLSRNPVVELFSGNTNVSSVSSPVRTLDLSSVSLPVLDVSVLDVFPDLQNLNLSHSGVHLLSASRPQPLSRLQVIDVRGSAVLEIPPRLFLGLDRLQQVYGDTHKLCCPQVLPAGFNAINCQAPVREISSCNNLLRSALYRLFLALFAVFALTGNFASFLFRAHAATEKKQSGHSVFVSHLCLSDGLMGIYLVVIGVSDRLYHNSYLWQDTAWKHSVVCRMAGFLALLSTEMSACVIFLITLDRFLVIRFPFSQLRFQRGSGHVTCCALWAVLTVIVSIPFFPVFSHWGFYSHTDICIPLPITRSSFAGHSYAFGVMIVLNMVLFVGIAVGQTAIYAAIRANTITAMDSNRQQQDLGIARRLVTIAATDFLCWFPVGLLGVLAVTGVAVPGEANVAMATLVMPLNSAMNPFLYTVNVLLEKRRQAREDRILKYLASHRH